MPFVFKHRHVYHVEIGTVILQSCDLVYIASISVLLFQPCALKSHTTVLMGCSWPHHFVDPSVALSYVEMQRNAILVTVIPCFLFSLKYYVVY